jgi:uncharacterized protein YndB with AHSA1/START domain
MTPAIQQSVEFDATPETLYEMYIDSKQHAQATGAPAKVSRRVGGTFTAFGGQLKGKNLLLTPNQMIVQACRAEMWKKSDPGSILVIQFSKTKTGTRVDLMHVNVPEHDHQGVTDGWCQYYWEPWRVYLEALALKKKGLSSIKKKELVHAKRINWTYVSGRCHALIPATPRRHVADYHWSRDGLRGKPGIFTQHKSGSGQ